MCWPGAADCSAEINLINNRSDGSGAHLIAAPEGPWQRVGQSVSPAAPRCPRQ